MVGQKQQTNGKYWMLYTLDLAAWVTIVGVGCKLISCVNVLLFSPTMCNMAFALFICGSWLFARVITK